jgi:hypothetical protein
MATPSVSVTKNVFTTAQAPADVSGILAICAASSTGTANQPAGFARSDLAVTAMGFGPLTEYAAYDIAVANKSVVLVKSEAASFVGAYGTLNSFNFGTGTSVVTAGSTAPYDDYNVTVTIVTGGTIGVTGIVYTYTTDGGNVTSGNQSLGTANTLTIANTGVSFALGAGTLLAGASWQCYTSRPQPNNTEALASLTALFNTRLPFEGVLLDCSMTTSTVGLIDTFLAAQEAKGIFKFVLINSPYKVLAGPGGVNPSAESEAAYATRMTTLMNNQVSIRQCAGADGAHTPSVITGWNLKRPTSMLLAARAMATRIGTDAAYVATGPLNGAQIADSNGNPLDHDEDLFPGLDAIRMTALRSFAPGGPQGTYICNANTTQPTGGAFPYLQHIRIANRACTIAWAILTTQLSRGVRKNPKPDPVTGAVYIFEPDASVIEGLVNDALIPALLGQVSDVQFSLSRTDNLAAVPAIVTGTISVVDLAYIKAFDAQFQYVKTISAPLGL